MMNDSECLDNFEYGPTTYFFNVSTHSTAAHHPWLNSTKFTKTYKTHKIYKTYLSQCVVEKTRKFGTPPTYAPTVC